MNKPEIEWRQKEPGKGLEQVRPGDDLPQAIITLPGLDSDMVKIWERICNTVAGCTFIVATAWVIVSLFGK